MTETTAKKKLPAAVERFVLQWGDMGDEWGVIAREPDSRSALFVGGADEADDIRRLGMARSNVSTPGNFVLEFDPACSDGAIA